jgi:hypothetical protein
MKIMIIAGNKPRRKILTFNFIIFEVINQNDDADEGPSLFIFSTGTQSHLKWKAKCHWSIDKWEINAMHLHRR